MVAAQSQGSGRIPVVAGAGDAAWRFILGEEGIKRRALIERARDATHGVDKTVALHHAAWPSSIGDIQGSDKQQGVLNVEAALQDVAMFDGVNGASPVFDAIDRTCTLGGSGVLSDLVRRPLASTDALRDRQSALHTLAYDDATHIHAHRRTLRDTEGAALWMFQCRGDEAVCALHDMAFFRSWMFRGLNRSSWALSALNVHRIVMNPLIGLLSPIVYFIVPYLIIRIKLGLRLSPVEYLRMAYTSARAANSALTGAAGSVWGNCAAQWITTASYLFSMVFYFQNIFNSVETSAMLRSICGDLHGRVAEATRFFEAFAALKAQLGGDDVTRRALQTWFPRASFAAPDAPPLLLPTANNMTHDASTTTNTTTPLWSRMGLCGDVLVAFKTMDLEGARASLREVYALDSLVSIRHLLATSGGEWRPAEFIDANGSTSDYDGPTSANKSKSTGALLDMHGLRHPQHSGTSSQPGVPNDWVLGGCGGESKDKDTSRSPGVILTGPNAGGKSTLLKATLCCALLAQSLTVAPCQGGCRITPFVAVCSQINVPDSQGVASLFEAEMRRSKRAIDTTRDADGFTLVVMDELFSSTNPIEGIAGAWAVARTLVAQSHQRNQGENKCLVVLSTHYSYLCRLERETHGLFRNFQLPVDVDDVHGHVVRYPYRLTRGVCRQCVAIELLQKAGFDAQLVQHALGVKRDLMRPLQRRAIMTGRVPAPTPSPSQSHEEIVASDESSVFALAQPGSQSTPDAPLAQPEAPDAPLAQPEAPEAPLAQPEAPEAPEAPTADAHLPSV
jgi:hypothetical protein